METVNILCDDGLDLARLFLLGKPQVGLVGLGIGGNHLVAVEAVELLSVGFIVAVAQHSLGRHGVFLVIQAIHTAEIGDTRLGGHARAAKKDDVVALGNHSAELVDIVHTRTPFG